MTTKRLCPSANGASALGKAGKRWGDVQTLALNGLAIATDGVANSEQSGLVMLATEAETQNPDQGAKAVTPAGLMAALNSRLSQSDKATTAQAEDGENNETWMTPALTKAAITELTQTPQIIPTGTIVASGLSTPPAGWLECNGASLSTSTYADLYATIGTTFGAGTGTFRLPDLRGEFLRGWDHGRGVDSGRGLGSAQGQSFQSHNHTTVVPNASYEGSGRGLINMTTSGSTSIASRNSGSSETRPRNIALAYLIKY